MGDRSSHAPGTFSWTDLTTTDQEAAKTFYTGLFGWQIEDMPAGEGVTYSMASLDGKHVGAISPQPDAMKGAPPMWNSYVTVESADAAADKASELGATALSPPFDVFDAGRMAVLQDPQGAIFFVWQPKQHIGAQLVTAPGALCWNELSTPDMEAASAFYGGLFGWSFDPFEGGDEPYLVVKNGERANGGIRPLTPPGIPPHWLVYFATADLDASVAQLEQLGGKLHAGPFELPMARIAVVSDPQGAPFALYAGDLDD